METEVWKKLEWFDFEYEVSSFWKVKNTSTGHIYKWQLQWKWYLICDLKINGRYKHFSIHRLVMLWFVWPSDLQVNHKNWIKTDNRICNLEYATQSENVRHSYYELWRNTPLWFKVKSVIQLTMNWEFVNQFRSAKEAQRITWIWQSDIRRCCIWINKQTAWFIWKYT